MIAAIAKKNKSSDHSDHNYGNHFPAIVAIAATTIAEIELFPISRSLEGGFHYDRYDRRELFFPQRSQRS